MASFIFKNSASVLRNYIPKSFKNIPGSQVRLFHVSPCLEKVISFNLSDIGEGIREVVVKEWFVKVGDSIEQFQNICEVQSDKASVTITSRYDGKITKLYHKIDDIALVGKPLVDFEIEDEEGETSDSSSSTSSENEENVKENVLKDQTDNVGRTTTLATPAVRRISREYKVDLTKVSGTGRDGRVLKGDVMEYLGHLPPGTNVPHPTLVNNKTDLTPKIPPADRKEPLKGVRKAMLKSMAESLKIPHFAYSDEIDMTKLIDFRDQLKSVAIEHGIPKLTFMPFFIKAASIALTKFPIINSSLDVENEAVIYKSAHNISVAIGTPSGLVVPNIKNCQSKSIMEIAKDLNSLVQRGRAGSLSPEDFIDGTFSLSNIGVIGGTYTHPCIMAPQVSIGAMGKTRPVPRYNKEGEIVKAYIMNVSWTADHRVIDGVTMASFSNVWKEHLENPALFLATN
ncbi:lipoamide acyltransferase component of branched-chain alpha-keto acid dehydrogenase complex, mitochondrial [Eupeodes corollae]|uniref:lipoamide acyltransferase component of branched-chain alpha-keto acid dehydrogenase complex, mitochondrial n=1 Tax=Eupeodes corollae TaxID=290404 RepID=UPI002492822E|nr:lipoamide acyltransferase component of branched-chain alpha-keto acid dehydrogenase complex, mitochondrial [Eupeodes corollae]